MPSLPQSMLRRDLDDRRAGDRRRHLRRDDRGVAQRRRDCAWWWSIGAGPCSARPRPAPHCCSTSSTCPCTSWRRASAARGRSACGAARVSRWRRCANAPANSTWMPTWRTVARCTSTATCWIRRACTRKPRRGAARASRSPTSRAARCSAASASPAGRALLSQGNLTADPRRLAAGLLRAAIARGARLHAPVEVSEVDASAAVVHCATTRGPQIRAGHVVFATGYEMPRGVPRNGHTIASTWVIATRAQPRALWPGGALIWEASDPYLYLRTTPDGRVICGGEDEPFVDEARRDALLPARRATLERRLARLFPASMPARSTAGPGPSAPRPPARRPSGRSPACRAATPRSATAATASRSR